MILWEPKFQNTTPPTNRSRKLSNFFLNFLLNGPHKTTFGIFEILKIEFLMNFLALLDYVTRAPEIEICPSSVVRRPPSVRVTIISEPNAQISFKFWLLLPLSHMLGSF